LQEETKGKIRDTPGQVRLNRFISSAEGRLRVIQAQGNTTVGKNSIRKMETVGGGGGKVIVENGGRPVSPGQGKQTSSLGEKRRVVVELEAGGK